MCVGLGWGIGERERERESSGKDEDFTGLQLRPTQGLLGWSILGQGE